MNIEAVKALAKTGNCYVIVTKAYSTGLPYEYLLYRRVPDSNRGILIGKSKDLKQFAAKVKRAVKST